MKDNKLLIEGIIFDLDGTLIDYEGISNLAMSKPLERLGVEGISWKRQSQLIGTPIQVWGRQVIDERNLTEKLDLNDYIKEYFDEVGLGYSKMGPLPGAMELINKFHSLKIPMAIATTTPRPKFDTKMVYHTKILEKMTCIVTGDEVINGKPAPDIFLLAASKLGKDPKKCIVFEDSPWGVQGANTAGCYSVAIPDSRMIQFIKEDFKIANDVINSLEEFDTEKIIKS